MQLLFAQDWARKLAPDTTCGQRMLSSLGLLGLMLTGLRMRWQLTNSTLYPAQFGSPLDKSFVLLSMLLPALALFGLALGDRRSRASALFLLLLYFPYLAWIYPLASSRAAALSQVAERLSTTYLGIPYQALLLNNYLLLLGYFFFQSQKAKSSGGRVLLLLALLSVTALGTDWTIGYASGTPLFLPD